MALDIIDPRLIDVTVLENTKTLGASSAITAANLNNNSVGHMRRLDMISEFFLSEATGQRAGVDPAEAISQGRIVSSDLSKLLAELQTVSTTMLAAANMMAGVSAQVPKTPQT